MFKKAPNHWKIENLFSHCNTAHKQINGRWVSARPLGYYSILSRVRLAWGVFCGRYDTLEWENQ